MVDGEISEPGTIVIFGDAIERLAQLDEIRE